MKYYKDLLTFEVFAYSEDGSQDHLIGDKVEMTAEEIDLHLNPPKTQEQMQQDISNAIQDRLDTFAQSYRYDNINAIGKYLGYDNVFRAECEAMGAWAAACWDTAGQIEADVLAALRPFPTPEEVLAELPAAPVI